MGGDEITALLETVNVLLVAPIYYFLTQINSNLKSVNSSLEKYNTRISVLEGRLTNMESTTWQK